LTRRNVFIALVGAGAFLSVATAQKAEMKTPDKHVLAEEHARQLLLLMGSGENFKISKQEWLRFMEEEFDRLDKKKTGELDLQELVKSNAGTSPQHFLQAGK